MEQIMRKNKILIIDDSKVIRTRFREMLPAGNFQIIEAKNGEQGLAYLHNLDPEIGLIILDFLLPIVSGWELYQEIQADAELNKIPLVIMSGRPEEVIKKIPEPFDSFEYLEKPFDKRELTAAIRAAFAKAKSFQEKNSQNLAPSETQKPREYDAVLGGKTLPVNAAVLGGIEGVKMRFKSPEARGRLQAVFEAAKYGDAGLDLLIAALKDESVEVKARAYLLLKSSGETKAIQALKKFNPWQLFQPLPDIKARHYERVSSLAITPDNQTLVSGSHDFTIKIWHLPTGELINSHGERFNMVNAVAIAPDGKFLVSGGNDKIVRIWNLQTGEQVRTIAGHQNRVNCLAISCDGRTIVSGSSDRSIKVWNFHTGELIKTLVGHSYSICALSLSFGGATLVSGSHDRTIKVWNLHTGELIRTLAGHRAWVNSVATSRDGGTIVSGSSDGTIKTWDLHTGEPIHTLFGDNGPVFAVAIAPDNTTIISSSVDGTIKIWDLHAGTLTTTLAERSDPIYSLTLSNDASILAAGSDNGNIAVWGLPIAQLGKRSDLTASH
jgi:WD40 repeat protein/CheY-like chemotaxis protein